MRAAVLTMAALLSLAACDVGARDPRPVGGPTPSATPAARSAVPGTADDRTHAAAMPAAYHEFQVFGDGAIWLSHYPMFSSIHAYQVIVQARLVGENGQDVEAVYRAFRRGHPGVGLSLSPTYPGGGRQPRRHDWVLPEEVHVGGAFTADLHWEADPEQFADMNARQYVARNVTVQIVRVARFQMFYPDSARRPELSYLLFGSGGEWWLAHRLTVHPDFDQVLRVRLDGPPPPTPADGGVIEVAFPNRPDDEARRLTVGERIVGRMTIPGAGAREATFTVVEQVSSEALEIQN